jgi:uncharacterized membrane protein (UPF0127 family)
MERRSTQMPHRREPTGERLRRLPRAEVLGSLFPVARGLRARLFGLAMIDREDAEPGLLIPHCRCVHTFGMRFPVDVVFLGRYGEAVSVRRAVPPRRVALHRAASAVLELPAGGEER